MTEKKKATYASLKGVHRAVPIILTAVAIFMLFCFILQDMGVVGNAISDLFLGLFSWGAYVIPLLLVLHAVFYAPDLDEKRILSRVIFSLITVTAISALSYAITYWNEELIFSASTFYKNGGELKGGGFIGGVVGFCLIKAFSRVGLVIIAAAVFAIYISYFFSRGQKGITKAMANVLRFLGIVAALIELGIKKLFRKAKNAKKEKTIRQAERSNTALTDDDYFAVDNGMETLTIEELGINETRNKRDAEKNPTLQEKVTTKSSVSHEEAAEMEKREKAKKIFYDAMYEDVSEDETPRAKKTISFDYGDTEPQPAQTPETAEEPKAAETVFEPVHIHDESADSVFTSEFDPFGMLGDEELASKPSSKSFADESAVSRKPLTFTEDISELTEEEVERAKRIKAFEARKAEIVAASRKATPVENGGEFTGTPKNVEFREEKHEEAAEIEEDNTSFSMKIDKSYDSACEKPTTKPANYTSIGFGDENADIKSVINENAFTHSETIYSHEEPSEPLYKRSLTSDGDSTASSAYAEPIYAEPIKPAYDSPSYAQPAAPAYGMPYGQPAAPVYGAPYGQPAAPVYGVPYTQPAAPVYGVPYAQPAAPVYGAPYGQPAAPAYGQPCPVTQPPIGNAPSYTAPEASAADSENTEKPAEASEHRPEIPVFSEPKPSEAEAEARPDVTYTASRGFDDSRDEITDYTPSFKPFTEPSADAEDNSAAEVSEAEKNEVRTLTLERTNIGDEDITPTTEFSGSYDSFSENPEDELNPEELYEGEDEDEDLEGFEPEDDDGFDTDEIPPEKRNPVVQGYRDMFTALRTDNDDVEFDDDESDSVRPAVEVGENDFKLISPDERDDYNEHNDDLDGDPDYDMEEDYGEDSDEPPFDEPTVTKPAAKADEPKPEKKKPDFKNFKMPPIELLGLEDEVVDDTSEINENTKTLIDTLASFNVTASIKGVDRGPRITRYEVVPARGVKVNSITGLFNDIALNLAREGIRMEAPIPGKSAIGFEIPNRHPRNVRLRELLECDEFKNAKSRTFVAIGKNVGGMPVFADIEKFPHALIAGATGMGKSVCINSIMISMLYKARPDEVRFIMIDPKKVEFKMYSGIPHLLIPVITDAKQAAGALMWAVEEMERRFELIEQQNVRNLSAYNEKVEEDKSIGTKLPRIIIVIDELNDLMMQVRDPVEGLVMRLAQKARAAGIHIIIGTQRPDVKVVTGTIKANIPTRMSCKVSSVVDSRTILEMAGAEKLLDKGDMLFKPIDKTKPIRVQGAFVSDSEVEAIMRFLKEQVPESAYDDDIFAEIKQAAQKCGKQKAGGAADLADDTDEDGGQSRSCYSDQRFLDAVHLAITSKKISTSLLQRKLSIGYGKAAKYIDDMEAIGVVSEPKGQKPRDVLITLDEWNEKLARVALD